MALGCYEKSILAGHKKDKKIVAIFLYRNHTSGTHLRIQNTSQGRILRIFPLPFFRVEGCPYPPRGVMRKFRGRYTLPAIPPYGKVWLTTKNRGRIKKSDECTVRSNKFGTGLQWFFCWFVPFFLRRSVVIQWNNIFHPPLVCKSHILALFFSYQIFMKI